MFRIIPQRMKSFRRLSFPSIRSHYFLTIGVNTPSKNQITSLKKNNRNIYTKTNDHSSSNNNNITSKNIKNHPGPISSLEMNQLLSQLLGMPEDDVFPLPITTVINIYSSLTNMSSSTESFKRLLESLYPHLHSHSPQLNFDQCSDILYCFQSTNQYTPFLSDSIKLIHSRMAELSSLTPEGTLSIMSISQIAKCMYGIKNFPNNLPEIKSILRILATNLSLNRSEAITIHEIHHIISCLHGRNMNLHNPELKSLTTSFCELIEYNYKDMTELSFKSQSIPSHFKNHIDSSTLSIFSYGPYITDILTSFSNQSSDYILTQQLLLSVNTILLKKDPSSKKPRPRYYLTPQQIGTCLSRMKHLSCEHDGVGEIVKSLSHYMVKSMNNPENDKEIYPVQTHLTGQAIANCLQGIRSMSDENPSVKQMLVAIYEKLRYFTNIQFTLAQLCQSLNGFRGMTSKYQKITQIVDILIQKIEIFQQEQTQQHSLFTGIDISLAFAGIQRMIPTESFPNLLKLVKILLDNGQPLFPKMTFSSLQIVFSSLTNMISSYLPIPIHFMESLLNHLLSGIQSPNRLPTSSESSQLDEKLLYQSLHIFHSTIVRKTPSSITIPLTMKSTINELISHLSSSLPLRETQNIENKYENKIFNRLQGLFQSFSNVHLTRHMIINGFSTDILLILRRGDSPSPSSPPSPPSDSSEISDGDQNHNNSDNNNNDNNSSDYLIEMMKQRSLNPASVLLASSSSSGREIIVNIEIDGPSHNVAKKHFYFDRRDGYFENILGIKVIRLSLKECGYQSGANLDNFLRKILVENIKFEMLKKKT